MNKRGIGIVVLIIVGLVVGGGVIFLVDKFVLDEPVAETVPVPEVVANESANATVSTTTTVEGTGEIHGEEGEQEDANITVSVPTPSGEGIVDLAAVNLTLENEGCAEANNTEDCSIKITGVIRNTGTVTITDPIVVHFYDAETLDFILIDSPRVDDDLASGDEKTLTTRYGNISRGSYFVQLKVDGTNSIIEVDENNNILNKLVQVYGPT